MKSLHRNTGSTHTNSIHVGHTGISESDRYWPVEIIRHTTERGWEKAVYERGKKTWVMATVGPAGIEIPRFRLRYRIYPKQTDQSSTKSALRRLCAKRRKRTIFVPSPRTGGIVLRFRSEQDCIEFFAKLSSYHPKATNRTDPSTTATTDASSVSSVVTEATSNKKDAALVDKQKQDAAVYLVKLMNDKCFIDYVDTLERTILSTNDGAKMLQSLAISSDSSSSSSASSLKTRK